MYPQFQPEQLSQKLSSHFLRQLFSGCVHDVIPSTNLKHSCKGANRMAGVWLCAELWALLPAQESSGKKGGERTELGGRGNRGKMGEGVGRGERRRGGGESWRGGGG